MPQVSLLTDSDPAPYSAGNYFAKLVATQEELNSKSAEIEVARGIEANLNARFTAVVASVTAINTDLTNNYYDKTGTEQYVQGQIMTGGVDWSTFGNPLDLLRLNVAGTAPEGVDPALYQTDWSTIGTSNQVIVMNGTGDDVVGVNASTLSSQMTTKVDLVTSTDNAIVRFDGTTGEVQDSLVEINNSGSITLTTGGTITAYSTGANIPPHLFETDGTAMWGTGANGDDKYYIYRYNGTSWVSLLQMDSAGDIATLGSVGVGTIPLYPFHVAGASYFASTLQVVGSLTCNGIYDLTTGAAANVVIAANGIFYRSTSSAKYKTDINYEGVDGSKVYNLKPVSFKDKKSHVEYLGFIAEDVHEVEPRLVDYDKDGNPDALHYGNFTALNTKAIQDLKGVIDSQQKQNDDLTSLINTQQQAITALQAEVDLLKP